MSLSKQVRPAINIKMSDVTVLTVLKVKRCRRRRQSMRRKTATSVAGKVSLFQISVDDEQGYFIERMSSIVVEYNRAASRVDGGCGESEYRSFNACSNNALTTHVRPSLPLRLPTVQSNQQQHYVLCVVMIVDCLLSPSLHFPNR